MYVNRETKEGRTFINSTLFFVVREDEKEKFSIMQLLKEFLHLIDKRQLIDYTIFITKERHIDERE